MKSILPWLSIFCTITLSSCAWLDSVERKLIGDEEPNTSAAKRPQMVPKTQYDELLARFEQTKRENEALKDGRPSTNPLVEDLQNAPVLTNQGVTAGPYHSPHTRAHMSHAIRRHFPHCLPRLIMSQWPVSSQQSHPVRSRVPGACPRRRLSLPPPCCARAAAG